MANFLAPRPLITALCVGIAALFALPQVCFACSCIPAESPAESAAKANAVFRAQVVVVERLEGRQGAQYQRAALRVTTVWKGTVTTETMIYTGSNSADCGYPFQMGGEYVIYANTNTATNDWPSAALTTSICSRTRPVAEAADDLAAFGPGHPPTPSLPNTGTGSDAVTSSGPLIPGDLIIAAGILVLLGIAGGSCEAADRRARPEVAPASGFPSLGVDNRATMPYCTYRFGATACGSESKRELALPGAVLRR
jgi:hypothetical protein